MEPPGTASVGIVANRRGEWWHLDVPLENRGRAGLAGCVRMRRVRLPRPLLVGPRPVPAGTAFPDLVAGWGEGASCPAEAGDVVRGVRDYVPGDPLRRVHWAVTARTGSPVVKEVEDPGAPTLVVVLDLGGGGEAGEVAAGRAASYAGEALRRGYRLVLATAEVDGPMTLPADSVLVVNRRLALAAPGRPRRPAGLPGRVPVLLVTPEGDSWD